MLVTCSYTTQQQQQQPFNGLCSGTTQVSQYQKKYSAFCLSIGLCCVQGGFPHLLSSGFYGAGEDNGGRGTDSPGGHHPNQTNGAHTPTTPQGFLQAGCHSCRPTNSVKALRAYVPHKNWKTGKLLINLCTAEIYQQFTSFPGISQMNIKRFGTSCL